MRNQFNAHYHQESIMFAMGRHKEIISISKEADILFFHELREYAVPLEGLSICFNNLTWA